MYLCAGPTNCKLSLHLEVDVCALGTESRFLSETRYKGKHWRSIDQMNVWYTVEHHWISLTVRSNEHKVSDGGISVPVPIDTKPS